MAWFKRTLEPGAKKKVKIPEGLWVKCDGCKEIIYKKEIEKNLKVCPKCNYHFRLISSERIRYLIDGGGFEEFDSDITSTNPLKFVDTIDYTDRIKKHKKESGVKEAVVSGRGRINGREVIMVIMDFGFMGGSMGSVVGEKITRATEKAVDEGLPFISVSSSGGARMQEGIFSLLQMAKVSAAIGRLKENRIPYISVLSDPTFGGVTASFAMLGDLIISEPRSLIGFAGPRVIEATIKKPLPPDFQRAEFLLEHGLIDMIVERRHMKETLSAILGHLVGEVVAKEEEKEDKEPDTLMSDD
jgi:acetyl-CoA carboxylase carboxyl transferase subunit beta